MFFGATSFSAAPFGDAGEINAIVTVSGNRINVKIGDVDVQFPITVNVNGSGFSLASSTADVIIWNTIPPNANQIWIPIDPDNP